MKKLLTIIWLLALSPALFAQLPEATKAKLETMRVGLISERLDLTPKQAEKFWPLYNQYLKQRNTLKTQYNTQMGGINIKNATEEETKKALELRLAFKTKELNLEKEYTNKLLNVISSQQIVSLRQAEQEFRKRVVEAIRKRQQQQRARQNERRKMVPERQRNRRGN